MHGKNANVTLILDASTMIHDQIHDHKLIVVVRTEVVESVSFSRDLDSSAKLIFYVTKKYEGIQEFQVFSSEIFLVHVE